MNDALRRALDRYASGFAASDAVDAVRLGDLGDALRIGHGLVRSGKDEPRGGVTQLGDEVAGALMSNVRPGRSSDTVKPWGTSRGRKTSDPGPASHRSVPQRTENWPSRTKKTSSWPRWTCCGGS